MATVTCKLPDALNAALDAAARARGLPKSAIIREVLEARLRRRGAGDRATALDLVRGLVGTLDGPADLASEPRHLDDFGA